MELSQMSVGLGSWVAVWYKIGDVSWAMDYCKHYNHERQKAGIFLTLLQGANFIKVLIGNYDHIMLNRVNCGDKQVLNSLFNLADVESHLNSEYRCRILGP